MKNKNKNKYKYKIYNPKKIILLKKILILIFLAGFQTLCYFFVNKICGYFSNESLFNLRTFFDDIIPYVGWTWIFYYSADIFMPVWGFIILFLLKDNVIKQTVLIYLLMIISGALLQILLPAQSPYPETITPVQSWFHFSVINAPYGCFPSMHIALCTLPLFIGFRVIKSSLINTAAVILVILISASTMTLKEHYFLDVISGLLFGLFFFLLWKYKVKKLIQERYSEGDAFQKETQIIPKQFIKTLN